MNVIAIPTLKAHVVTKSNTTVKPDSLWDDLGNLSPSLKNHEQFEAPAFIWTAVRIEERIIVEPILSRLQRHATP